jgi:type IV pilus assembly protein PilO
VNATAQKLPSFDLSTLADDFRSLDPRDPGLWPPLPRAIILLALLALILLAGWWFGWRPQLEELNAAQAQEQKLKQEWLDKKRQSVNLAEYQKQLTEINAAFGALLKQLPNASEMDSLLVDINQAGLGRGLQFELFKPSAEAQKEFYAELPITIRVTGSYHDLGSFVGDIARLPRIVTLNDIEVAPNKEGTLTMAAVAKTFRYLDDAEVARQKKEKAAAKKDKKAGGA